MSYKPRNFGKGSVEVESNPPPGQAPTRRLAITADKLVTQPFEGIDTVYDILAYAARTHGTNNAMGWREVVDVHEEEKDVKKVVGGKEVTEKKKWKYFQLSEYKYINFLQVKDAVTEVSKGLLELGVGKDDIFNVYAQTSLNWQLMAFGCSCISTAIATAYDTLGESGLTHSLNEPNCVGIFTNGELLPVVSKVIANVPSLRIVVYDDKPSQSVLDSIKNSREGITVIHIDELRKVGQSKTEDIPSDRLPTRDRVACIMYTSGTTGPPKGVVITQGNLIASVGAVYTLLGHLFIPGDSFLAYLPLAHILEYIVELALFFVGMTIGYGRVRTLTDQSVRQCKGDLSEFKPSIMVGVPAVWETIRKGIIGKINSTGTVKKSVFNGAMSVKKAGVPGLSQIVDNVVLAQVKAATGGRLRFALSGGAALSKETQEFLNLALVTMLQGYGMTESCGMCAILPPEFMQYGSVGLPVPSIEIKLLDVPEAGYRATNNPPQGEVCIRGPSVTKGYYKRDDLNNDETIFTKDGWLRTGDVGQWNKDGTLSLIDRIKNLVKLQGGEYIALERLESTYKSCNLVSNICVHATTDAKQPIAIIIPNEQHLRATLKTTSDIPEHTPLSELCQKDKVKELVLKECNAAGKKSGFKSLEMLQAVILTPDEWTPENGLVTAAQKVQRKKVAEKFDKEIKEAYKNQG
ncbi:long-chain-fatty-acid-CoA-ligase [Gloeophyllum trabeum ATCC 11539]|uniref:Long-chain-fatty-acid-CoA-ligase n=1 Tax=Gloeophyllum trabeum (strain ATCC 11539 / FP-39264 / Madison 617) TaxID=670483 RepID=S7RSL5_GLOTA|nr:long-chain-fatty-acid-CoA-ligase [Gloeophyllum trabeum ATCC 11539]EPQ56009.1 long-chain-fatty-acid-CoA-ligase [Gloeophyllum trabeum ATCC 11539]